MDKLEISEELKKLFESNESDFEIKKAIYKITEGLNLGLLVELNNTFIFEYWFKKLIGSAGVYPTLSEEETIRQLKEYDVEDRTIFGEFRSYYLKNGLLSCSTGTLKIENLPFMAYYNVFDESHKFAAAIHEYLTDIISDQPQPDTAPTEKYLGQPINEKANEFFDFLIEYYRPEDKTQIKYVNILHYLKNDAEKKHFIFKVKQSEYKILVKEKTGIEIKKFAKSERYIEEQKPIFHKLENTFLKNKTV